MKKILSLILTLTLILPCISAFALEAFAESDYEKLWQEKLEYEKDKSVSYGQDNMYSLSYGYDYSFILFTEQRDKLTYTVINKNEGKGNGIAVSRYWYSLDSIDNYDKMVVSTELLDIVNSCPQHDFESGISAGKSEFRHIVRTLGISYDELKNAFYRMENEPEYVREIFSYMTDDEFSDLSNYFKSCATPQNFVLEAACMDDDNKAEALLAPPGSVYIKERGMIFSSISLLRNSDLTVEEICNFDLTTNSFAKFISDMENTVDKFGDDEWKDKKGRTPTEKYALIVAEQEKQLKNPSTGEAVYLIPVAIVSFALGALVIYPRRRKIDNI